MTLIMTLIVMIKRHNLNSLPFFSQVWFQNRRSKWKKGDIRKEGEEDETAHAGQEPSGIAAILTSVQI